MAFPNKDVYPWIIFTYITDWKMQRLKFTNSSGFRRFQECLW